MGSTREAEPRAARALAVLRCFPAALVTPTVPRCSCKHRYQSVIPHLSGQRQRGSKMTRWQEQQKHNGKWLDRGAQPGSTQRVTPMQKHSEAPFPP
jgi:hypothetical protein